MKVVGLTGGIGSGKTQILNEFERLGIPVFNADREARKLMEQDTALKNEIKTKFGKIVFDGAILNRKKLAEIVFSDSSKLTLLNEIVHPRVRNAFELFKEKNSDLAPYIIKEAAILFESGGWKNCDKTILVCAPVGVRLERVMKRDGTGRNEVLARMDKQWPDEKKIPMADFVIHNTDWTQTQLKISKLHQVLSS